MHPLITAELNNLNTMSQCIFIQIYLKTQFLFLSMRKLFHVTMFFKNDIKLYKPCDKFSTLSINIITQSALFPLSIYLLAGANESVINYSTSDVMHNSPSHGHCRHSLGSDSCTRTQSI